ncbi:MAG: sulfotransferase domain-containing protein [Planctomycetes bacterium]|nr:sulfotransferase domain-containing protein [Planctomycetota bacterium]
MQIQAAEVPVVRAAPSAAVLQISYVKSGSYFLWKTIDTLFRAHGSHRSFVARHPIQRLRTAWPDFSIEQFDIDQILIQEDGVHWTIEMQHLEPITDLPDYVAACSHVWTHSMLCERSWQVYPRFGRRCIIIRDPRDALISMAHFVQTPFMRRYHPHPAESAEEYVASELTPFLEDWCRHTEDHLRARRALDIEVLHYERLTADLDAAVRHLDTWIGLGLDDTVLRSVAEAVSLSKMQQQNPQHVRNGRRGGFRDQLTQAQQKRALAIVAPTMRAAGYDV